MRLYALQQRCSHYREVQFLPKDGLPSHLAEKMLYMYIKKDLFILMYIWYLTGIGNSVFKDLLVQREQTIWLINTNSHYLFVFPTRKKPCHLHPTRYR